MWLPRTLETVLPEFGDKLIIVYGPRQCGKSCLIEKVFKPDIKLILEDPLDRKRFKIFSSFLSEWLRTQVDRHGSSSLQHKPVVFVDEIHKVKGWRDIIKSTYDRYSRQFSFVASGSSAFHIRKRDKGDSLAGRAAWFRLDPLTFREFFVSQHPRTHLARYTGETDLFRDRLTQNFKYQKELRKVWDVFSQYGSFPENLSLCKKSRYEHWLKDYLEALLNRDLKDLNVAKDVDRVHQTFELLMEGLGSTYSMRSLSETLQVAVATIKSDISALRQVLWGFDLAVSQVTKSKQIRREKKFYPVDFCLTHYAPLKTEGAFFESQVACLLHRFIHQQESLPSQQMTLGYYRDYNQREVDFILRDKKNIFLAAECKHHVRDTPHLTFFAKKFNPRDAILIVEEPGILQTRERDTVVSIELFASVL